MCSRLWNICCTLSCMSVSLSYTGAPNDIQYSICVLQVPNTDEKSLLLTSCLCFCPVFGCFYLSTTAVVQCSLVLSLPTSTCGSLPLELLSSCLASSLCQCADDSSPCARHFLNSGEFLPAHFSSLLRTCSNSLLPFLKMHMMFVSTLGCILPVPVYFGTGLCSL